MRSWIKSTFFFVFPSFLGRHFSYMGDVTEDRRLIIVCLIFWKKMKCRTHSTVFWSNMRQTIMSRRSSVTSPIYEKCRPRNDLKTKKNVDLIQDLTKTFIYVYRKPPRSFKNHKPSSHGPKNQNVDLTPRTTVPSLHTEIMPKIQILVMLRGNY